MTPHQYNILWSASHDAGERNRRRNRRSKWYPEDWDVASQEFERLLHELNLSPVVEEQ